jgi:hypothetical protein
MENKGLLFIPDISGFTRFIQETEIEHSRLIIQELLETLITCNEIGLQISEIEGDAILFYRFGEPPQLDHIYKQVEKMFVTFHRNLIAYNEHKYCQCKACLSAVGLTLKVITHYGEFAGYNVQNFNKLIGKDVIVAHQLLKNDIDQHEYWLVTDQLLGHNVAPHTDTRLQWNSAAKETESGVIPFHYATLSRLKERLEPEPTLHFDVTVKKKVISLTQEYDVDIIRLFHASGDFNYRSAWMEGVQKVEGLTHLLPRVGMQCRATMENGQVVLYSSGYRYDANKIEFSETDQNNHTTFYYTLQQLAPGRSSLTIDYYIPKGFTSELRFNLFQKQRKAAALHRSMQQLHKVVSEIKLPAASEV